MAKRQEFSSFLAYCAASGLCGALSATCGKEARAASTYITAAMYSAMLALGSTPYSIPSSHRCFSLCQYSCKRHRRLDLLLRNTSHPMVAGSSMFDNWNSARAASSQRENRKRARRVSQRSTATPEEREINNPNHENANAFYNDFSDEEEGNKEEIRGYKLPYKYIAEVAYDGTRYNGFQLQNATASSSFTDTLSSIGSLSNEIKRRKTTHPPPTIQGKLEYALTKFLAVHRDELVIQGAGRTDAGVHARGQVVHFFSKRLLEDTDRAVRALNSLLPEDILVLSLLRVPLDYNVRFSIGKIYTYDLHLDPLGSDPFTHRYRLCPRSLLHNNTFDFEAFSSAAAVFVGTHDFSAFSSKPRDGSQRSPERTIRRCEIVAAPPQFLVSHVSSSSSSYTALPSDSLSSSIETASSGGASKSYNNSINIDPLLRIEIEGDGFLYKQVRHMVGAMLAAAAGRITASDISKALADPITKGGREGGKLAHPNAYVIAEAYGLCLKQVFIPDPGNPEDLMYGEQGPVLKRRKELTF